MKNLNDIVRKFLEEPTNESIRSFFARGAEFKATNPSHRRLYDSFINWLENARKEYDDNLILNMLSSVEEDMEYGAV